MEDMYGVSLLDKVKDTIRTFPMRDSYLPYAAPDIGHRSAMQWLLANLQKVQFDADTAPNRLGKISYYIDTVSVPVNLLLIDEPHQRIILK